MLYDVIIIGSGPAGCSAAIYLARAALNPLLFSGIDIGGQLIYTSQVENYPGFSQGILGAKLMLEMRQQAQKFGTKIIDTHITKVDFTNSPFTVWQENVSYKTKAIIIATGAKSLTLDLEKEKQFIGKGISTCAVCDAAFYKDKTVYVVGGGDAAMEDTLALAKYAKKIYLVVRKDNLKATKIMQDRVLDNIKIKILFNTEIKKLLGQDKLSGLIIFNNKTLREEEVKTDGLFYAIGHIPNSDLFKYKIKIDEKGYILTSINGLHKANNIHSTWLESFPTMTSVDGIFAAGDVVDFRYRQAITASGFGCMAAIDAGKWLTVCDKK
jgi:thioredoxin reductase (NADPH)